MFQYHIDTTGFENKLLEVRERMVTEGLNEVKAEWQDELEVQQNEKQGEWAEWSDNYRAWRNSTGIKKGYTTVEKLYLSGNMMRNYKTDILVDSINGRITIPYPPVGGTTAWVHQHGFEPRNVAARPFDTRRFIERAKEVLAKYIK